MTWPAKPGPSSGANTAGQLSRRPEALVSRDYPWCWSLETLVSRDYRAILPATCMDSRDYRAIFPATYMDSRDYREVSLPPMAPARYFYR